MTPRSKPPRSKPKLVEAVKAPEPAGKYQFQIGPAKAAPGSRLKGAAKA